MKRWMWAALIATLSAASGCSEGGAGTATTGTAGGGGGGTQTTTGNGGSTSTGTTSTSTGTTTSTSMSTGTPGEPIINEIAAKGADWIEIANPGDSVIDLGGYGLCGDVDPTQGPECDIATIARFPQGTTLPPGGYLLILGDQDPVDGVGPHVMCLPDGGPTTCFYASWKVSASNGETVHLLDPKDEPVDEVLYPKDAVPSGQTWGRVPDMTGGFAENDPTPGAANMAP